MYDELGRGGRYYCKIIHMCMLPIPRIGISCVFRGGKGKHIISGRVVSGLMTTPVCVCDVYKI